MPNLPEYIQPPIRTDFNAVAAEIFDAIQVRLPQWAPAEGNFEVILSEAFARVSAEVRDLASAMATAIFRYYGMSILGILPEQGTRAIGVTTWTARDDAGYTVTAGTTVAIRVSGDQFVPFRVLSDVTIPAGDTATSSGEVSIEAVNVGLQGAGLTGDILLVDSLAWVQDITLVGETTGGSDPETDRTYLNRLTEQLTLLAPRPILPQDFALMALNVPGVERAMSIDGYAPFTNEKKLLKIVATGGTFTLTFNSHTTANIDWDATKDEVYEALVGLIDFGVSDIGVSGGPLPDLPIIIEFQGDLIGTDVGALTGTSSLTGPGAGLTITDLVQGSSTESFNNERMDAIAVIDAMGNPLASDVKAQVDAYLEARREVNFVIWIIDPTANLIDIVYEVIALEGQDPQIVLDSINAALATYLSPANWGKPRVGNQRSWNNQTKVRYLEIAQVINEVNGVDYIVSLNMAIRGDSVGPFDIDLEGVAPLPYTDDDSFDGTVNLPS